VLVRVNELASVERGRSKASGVPPAIRAF